MTVRLASFNVENLFARAKALDPANWQAGEGPLAAFDTFNRVAANPVYSDADRRLMLDALVTLNYLVRTEEGLRLNPDATATAWAMLRENRGDFLRAPGNGDAYVVATGRGSWIGWVELTTEPVDETATRMTARVITDVAADILVVVEADSRPSLVRFNESLLDGRYGHTMLIDGNDQRGIDVGLYCTTKVSIESIRSSVDIPDPQRPNRLLFSRDCPVYRLRLPGGDDLYVLPNHLKSQSFSSGNPDPLRSRQAQQVRAIYEQLVADGARYVAVLGDFNKGPDKANPAHHPTLEALLDPGSPLVNAYSLPAFTQLWGDRDVRRERPGTFQSCVLTNRLDYILLSPELAAKVTDGGVFRKGLWGGPETKNPPTRWTIYPEITSSRQAASDHAAVWVDLDL